MTAAERAQLEADVRFARHQWQRHKAQASHWRGRYTQLCRTLTDSHTQPVEQTPATQAEGGSVEEQT